MNLTSEQRAELIRLAQAARQRAYAPYSNYWVGAALLTASGKYYQGANIENAAYPTCICAERVAIFQAVFEGESDFAAIAVVTANGGTPCGSCRQVMAEFGLQTVVLIADAEGRLVQETTVKELLPGSFGPSDLKT
ncbi:MAG TPA: cytidine deaminase [Anaerolineales bacterium]|nr:cytidine deaminase [Anaerolineales bacterium]